MPYGTGTYGKKVGRPKKAAFKNCKSCKSKAKCKAAKRCMSKK